MKTIRIFISLAFSLFLVNCSNDNDKEIENSGTTNEEVKLQAETNNVDVELIQTRAGTIKAFDNKSFHLIVRDASGSNYFTELTREVITGTAGVTTPATESPVNFDSGSKLYWDDLGGVSAKLELFGIYPKKSLTTDYKYSENEIEWKVGIDSDPDDGIDDYDLMVAYKNPYNYSKLVAANLLFEHVLTKVSIKLTEGAGFAGGDLSTAQVTYNVPTEGKCNIQTQVATGTNQATLVPTKAADGSYTILTFPFKVAMGSSYHLATIKIGNNDYNVVLKDDLKDINLQKGVHNTFNVTIDKSDVKLTASLVDWEEPNPFTESAKLVTVGDFTINNAKDDKVIVTNQTIINLAITDSKAVVHKRTFTYDEGDKSWTPNTELYWDDMAYPFTSVKALMILGGNSNADKGDYIFTASASNVPLGGAIALGEFKHPLVKLTITVTTNKELGATDNVNLDGIQQVVINNSKLFEIKTDGITVSEGSTALTAIEDGSGTHTYVAFMMPKKLTKLCDITIQEDVNNNNTYPVNITETQLEAGQHYKYTVKITKTDVKFTGSLVDWDPQEGGEIGTGLE